MSGVWGNKIKYSIFGESHGPGIGIIIDGLPAGVKLDLDMLKAEMDRRKPGKSNITTSRKEEDLFEILSGFFNGYTTGTPLCVYIRNSNQHSSDYEYQKDYLRPGHADYPAYVKARGFNDFRGGGHFSGRITAPFVFAGAIAKQLLSKNEINIGSHIYSIGTEKDVSFMDIELDKPMFEALSKSKFPTINKSAAEAMQKLITDAKSDGDSIGGIIECSAINLPVGIGSPFFDSLESSISHLVFSIPGVKGIEFGRGFEIAQMKGSEAKDEYYLDSKEIKTTTNHNGGILGGLSTGMPMIFKAAFKPTSSISIKQNTVNISAMENAELSIKGRHDPCIVTRAVPVIEAAAAIAILEHIV